MINRVILNAHKGAEKKTISPPYRRYAKYAVSAAAAVAVVSAAVISMPYWQKTRDDGVIIEGSKFQHRHRPICPESVVSNTADTSYPYPTDSPKLFKIPIPLPITIRIVKLERRKRTVTIRVVTIKSCGK